MHLPNSCFSLPTVSVTVVHTSEQNGPIDTLSLSPFSEEPNRARGGEITFSRSYSLECRPSVSPAWAPDYMVGLSRSTLIKEAVENLREAFGMVNFMCHKAGIPRFLVKHSRCCCEAVFWMRLTFTLVDVEQTRLPSVMGVSPIHSTKGLHRQSLTFPEGVELLPGDHI